MTLLGWHLAFVDPVTFLDTLTPLFVMWGGFFLDCVSEL